MTLSRSLSCLSDHSFPRDLDLNQESGWFLGQFYRVTCCREFVPLYRCGRALVPPSAATPGARGKRGDGNACDRGFAEAQVLSHLCHASCHSESLSEALASGDDSTARRAGLQGTGQGRPANPRDVASVHGASEGLAVNRALHHHPS